MRPPLDIVLRRFRVGRGSTEIEDRVRGVEAGDDIWLLLGVVCVAGAVGGVINALLSDNGFVLPRQELVSDVSVLRPGVIGNILVGAVAAGVSWGLYGPLAVVTVLPLPSDKASTAALTLSALVGAVLVGAGGARWLTNEIDKSVLKSASTKAAAGKTDATVASQMAGASPINVLKLAGTL
jgi:hypothetical protein